MQPHDTPPNPETGMQAILAAIQAIGSQVQTLNQTLSGQIQTLSNHLTKFESKFNDLPDVYPPRREFNEVVTNLRDKLSDQHARLTAIEEWRLAETQRQAAVQIGIQQQISQEAQATNKGILQSRLSSMSGINGFLLIFCGALVGGLIMAIVYLAMKQ